MAERAMYRKTALVEAYMFGDPDMPQEFINAICYGHSENGHAHIHTLEGGHLVGVTDWVAKGIKGEFWPIKDDIFQATYEPVTATEQGGEGIESSICSGVTSWARPCVLPAGHGGQHTRTPRAATERSAPVEHRVRIYLDGAECSCGAPDAPNGKDAGAGRKWRDEHLAATERSKPSMKLTAAQGAALIKDLESADLMTDAELLEREKMLGATERSKEGGG